MTETPDRPLSDDDIETVGEPAGSDIPAAGQDADGVDQGADADTQDHGPGGHDTDGTDGIRSDGTDGDGTDGVDGDSSGGDGTDGGDTDGTDSAGARINRPSWPRCVGDEDEFFAEYWGAAAPGPSRPLSGRLRRPADPGLRRRRDVGWFTYASVSARQGRHAPAAGVVHYHAADLRGTDHRVGQSAEVLAAIDDGATLVLQGMHRFRRSLRELCRGLEDRLGCPCQVNAYFTPPGQQYERAEERQQQRHRRIDACPLRRPGVR